MIPHCQSGLLLGLMGVFALSRLLTRLTADLLFEVRPTDLAMFTAIALLMVIVAPAGLIFAGASRIEG